MGVRSESTRLENPPRTDPVVTEGGPRGAGASSVGAEAGAVASPAEVETEATVAADLIPEAEAITAPETTIIAGEGSTCTGGRGEAVEELKPVEEELSSCKASAVCPAGVKVAMETGTQEAPTETATTVTVSPASTGSTEPVCCRSSEPAEPEPGAGAGSGCGRGGAGRV
ncbi:hypothetical protein Nmel_018058 [Mimus melanotis]